MVELLVPVAPVVLTVMVHVAHEVVQPEVIAAEETVGAVPLIPDVGTEKSPLATPVTGSEKVAVHVSELALVGLVPEISMEVAVGGVVS